MLLREEIVQFVHYHDSYKTFEAKNNIFVYHAGICVLFRRVSGNIESIRSPGTRSMTTQ